MIKILAIILLIGGAISLVLGVLGIFGSISLNVQSLGFGNFGIYFFIAGMSMLKRRKDTDEV